MDKVITDSLAGSISASQVRTLPSADAQARRALWISWERHRRTRELARSLGLELREITSSAPSGIRYLSLFVRTLMTVARRRPAVLVVQCPSLLLGIWAAVLKPLFGYRLVADLHNEAVEPINLRASWYQSAFAWIRRAADMNVVTNDALKALVEAEGGRAIVVPDKVPELEPSAPTSSRTNRRRVVFICTYAIDEPVHAFLEAARFLGADIDVFVTGDRRRAPADIVVPPNVQLTGFLPEHAYAQLLADADVLVDLTSLENCLVCGAYEALALEKPLVTSDTRALRSYFRVGTVYTQHEARAIAGAIGYAIAHANRLTLEMRRLKRRLRDEWASQRAALESIIRTYGSTT